jgi:hypothetical protein
MLKMKLQARQAFGIAVHSRRALFLVNQLKNSRRSLFLVNQLQN